MPHGKRPRITIRGSLPMRASEVSKQQSPMGFTDKGEDRTRAGRRGTIPVSAVRVTRGRRRP